MDYGLSSEMQPNDERQAAWAEQRRTRGFDSTELWNLDVTFAKFIVPRLKAFKELEVVGYPGNLTAEKWEKILGQMISGFSCLIDGDVLHDKEQQQKKIDLAAKLFAKHLQSLWY